MATARRLVAEGADVFITGRHQEALEEAVRFIGSDKLTAIRGDMSELSEFARIFATITKRSARSTSLLQTLGWERSCRSVRSPEINTIVRSARTSKAFYGSEHAAAPTCRRSVILNASTSSITGTPGFSIYSATKAAVRNLARSWIIDLRGRDIRANVISPGVVPTPGYDALGLSAAEIQEFIDTQVATIPLGRVGTPDEIASVVSFLASNDSSFINGVELYFDGGMTQV